jgi:hypothetical protein
LGVQPGDVIEFEEEGAGARLRKRPTVSSFGAYRGYLAHLAGRNPDELVWEMRGE